MLKEDPRSTTVICDLHKIQTEGEEKPLTFEFSEILKVL